MNSLTRIGGYRPTTQFQTRAQEAFKPQVEQSMAPQMADLNTVNPMFRNIYQSYNDNVMTLNDQETGARKSAQANAGLIQGNFDQSINQAENVYTDQLDNVRSSNRDAQLNNKLRARAIGGAPSSGFLEMSNRTDVESAKDAARAGRTLAQGYLSADQVATNALNTILTNLDNTIAQINADRRLTLRQRDQAISDAQIKAANEAAMLNSLLGEQGGGGATDASFEGDVDLGGNVKGINTATQQYYNPITQKAQEAPMANVNPNSEVNVFNNGVPWYQDLLNAFNEYSLIKGGYNPK